MQVWATTGHKLSNLDVDQETDSGHFCSMVLNLLICLSISLYIYVHRTPKCGIQVQFQVLSSYSFKVPLCMANKKDEFMGIGIIGC